jgi:peptide/nickel transport system permease protein
MLEVLNADYLRTARAKGVPEETVIRKHALGNAWIPILTTIGTSLSVSLAGSAVVETVFAWPGVGRAVVDAVMARDVPTTCGLVIMTTILYVILQLVVDLLYAFVDPRIKSAYAKKSRKKKHPAQETAAHSLLFSDAPAMHAPPESGQTSPGTGFAAAAAVSGGGMEAVSVRDSAGLFGQEKPMLAQSDVRIAQQGEAAEQSGAAEQREAERRQYYTRDIFSIENKSSGAQTTMSDDDVEQIIKKYKKRSQMGDIFHRIRKNKSAIAGLIIIVILFLILLGSFAISFESATATSSANRFRSPDWGFPFGGDNMGRNTFLRTIYGTRYSLVIGFGAVAIATFIGIALGSVAGYYGGIFDDIIMRLSDVIASIPGMLLGMVIVSVLGQNLAILILAVGVTAVPVFLRITRASILSLRSQEFVEAARAIGISNFRIVFTQVLPNGLSPIIVTVTASIGLSIIVAASLSFLGFGVPVPHPEWGALISAGRNYIRNAPWLTTFPGLFIMITVLAFNLLGDGLRDALDPKLKR